MKRLFLIPALALAGCGVPGLLGTPPASVAGVARIARGPIDFALHSFDAALFGFDLAMDLKRPAAGTPEAKRLAALGRRVLAALSIADEAQKAGISASYDEAFARANTAFDEFRQLLGVPSTDLASALERSGRPVTDQDRRAILARAESNDGAAVAFVLGR